VGRKTQRLFGTIGLVVIAIAIAKIGRIGLDWIIGRTPPEWATVTERVGGWLIGLTVGGVVILPLLRLYDFLRE